MVPRESDQGCYLGARGGDRSTLIVPVPSKNRKAAAEPLYGGRRQGCGSRSPMADAREILEHVRQ